MGRFKTILFIIILVVLIYYLIKYFSGTNKEKSVAKKVKRVFFHLDDKYEQFAQKRIDTRIIRDNTLDMDIRAFVQDAMLVLKPDIGSLIALINQTEINVQVDYDSTYFDNVLSLANTFLSQNYNNQVYLISEHDKKMINQAFEDAIIADLKKRENELKSTDI